MAAGLSNPSQSLKNLRFESLFKAPEEESRYKKPIIADIKLDGIKKENKKAEFHEVAERVLVKCNIISEINH